jgi:hypothetical protein
MTELWGLLLLGAAMQLADVSHEQPGADKAEGEKSSAHVRGARSGKGLTCMQAAVGWTVETVARSCCVQVTTEDVKRTGRRVGALQHTIGVRCKVRASSATQQRAATR